MFGTTKKTKIAMLKLNDKLKITEIAWILVKNEPKSIFEQNNETTGWPFFNLLYFIIFYLFLLENVKKRTLSRFLPKSLILHVKEASFLR